MQLLRLQSQRAQRASRTHLLSVTSLLHALSLVFLCAQKRVMLRTKLHLQYTQCFPGIVLFFVASLCWPTKLVTHQHLEIARSWVIPQMFWNYFRSKFYAKWPRFTHRQTLII